MPSSITLDDAAFRSALATEAKRMQRDATKRMEDVGEQTATTARQRCPVDTGALRASIAVAANKTPNGTEVEISTGVSYARFVEFGTSDRPAQPFLRPALAEVPQRWSR